MKANKLLWRTSFISHFSRSEVRPFNSAVTRIALAWAAAIAFGMLVATTLWHANLPQDLPTFWLLCVIAVVDYVLGGFIIFAVNGATSAQSRNAGFESILSTLPVRRHERWLLKLMPTTCILLIVFSLSVPILAAIAHAMHSNMPILLLGFVYGLFSGLGLTLFSKPRSVAHTAAIFIASASLNIWILTKTVNISSPRALNFVLFLALTLLALPLYGYVDLYKNIDVATSVQTQKSSRSLMPKPLTTNFWFIIKLLRNRRSLSSLSVCMLFSLSTALLLARQSANITSTTWLVLPAVLSAAYACDIRGLMRRYRAPEITLVAGSSGITVFEITGAYLISLLIGLPIFLALAILSRLDINILVSSFLAIQLFSASSGLLASTMFVPTSGDIGSQFFSAMLATSAVLIFPKLAGLNRLNMTSQNLRWFSVGLFCWFLVVLIEQKRSNNYGSA